MSAPPPPPPPPSSAPPITPPSTVWDRRALREQRRAAEAAARQQRALHKIQMRALRRTSIFGPLLLVAIGVLFLLLELGRLRPDAVLQWMAHWWPLLLLSAGIVLIAEWAVDTRRAGQGHATLPRRTLGAGGAFLLILVTIAGLGAMAVRNTDFLQHNLSGDMAETWDFDQIFAQHTEETQELTSPLAPGALLSVKNYKGDINITGESPDGQVHVSVHQRWVGWSSDDLSRKRRQSTPRLQKDGSGLLLTVPGEGRDKADLIIQVPHESALELYPERGEISVSEVRGPLSIGEHHGNILLTGLTGHVHLTSHDDSAAITGHSLSGDLILEGRSGDLTFSDVTGPLTLHGDFFGTTHLERIKGSVHFQSSFTDLTCASIPGSLTVDGRSELEADDIEGPVVLSTSDRNLSLVKVRHGASVTDRNGSVTLSLADPAAPVKVVTTDGSIELRVPEHTAFALAAQTADGQIRNDLGLTPEQNENRTSLSAQIGKGGPAVTLQTTDGDITVQGTSAGIKGQPRSKHNESQNSDPDDKAADD